MPNLLRVDGSWPDPIEISAGWFRARARPWNEEVTEPMLRLERGGAEFLIAVGRRLVDLGAGDVYSPALYPGSTRVWRRAGFEVHASLDVMERGLPGPPAPGSDGVVVATNPDWERILDVDRSAFEGFWGMSRLGLAEAHATNRDTALLVITEGPDVGGYAIVGSQWGTVYLHRIAVRPSDSGRGLGQALLAAAIGWGSAAGGRSMVLNVRPENERAKRLYRKLGFTDTGTALEVLRLPGSRLLR